ncbi:unnamed protein product [Malus baccata var. baccata]
MSSLDRYLIHRCHNKMQRFSICWKSFSSQTLIKHSDERFRIITWINGAVRCNVEELHLDFSAKGTVTFALPSCTLRSESLQSLSVQCFNMILLAPSLSFSCNLHYLKLSFVRIVDERFCKWI